MDTYKTSMQFIRSEILFIVLAFLAGLVLVYFGMQLDIEDYNRKVVRFYLFKGALLGSGAVAMPLSFLAIKGLKKHLNRVVKLDSESFQDSFLTPHKVAWVEIETALLTYSSSPTIFEFTTKSDSEKLVSRFGHFTKDEQNEISSFIKKRLGTLVNEESINLD